MAPIHIKITITPGDGTEPYVREFQSRHAAQVFIDDKYGARQITREEWSRLFDRLSEPAGGQAGGKTVEKDKPQCLVTAA